MLSTSIGIKDLEVKGLEIDGYWYPGLARPPAQPSIGLHLASAARIVQRAFDKALAEAGGSLPIWLGPWLTNSPVYSSVGAVSTCGQLTSTHRSRTASGSSSAGIDEGRISPSWMETRQASWWPRSSPRRCDRSRCERGKLMMYRTVLLNEVAEPKHCWRQARPTSPPSSSSPARGEIQDGRSVGSQVAARRAKQASATQ